MNFCINFCWISGVCQHQAEGSVTFFKKSNPSQIFKAPLCNRIEKLVPWSCRFGTGVPRTHFSQSKNISYLPSPSNFLFSQDHKKWTNFRVFHAEECTHWMHVDITNVETRTDILQHFQRNAVAQTCVCIEFLGFCNGLWSGSFKIGGIQSWCVWVLCGPPAVPWTEIGSVSWKRCCRIEDSSALKKFSLRSVATKWTVS